MTKEAVVKEAICVPFLTLTDVEFPEAAVVRPRRYRHSMNREMVDWHPPVQELKRIDMPSAHQELTVIPRNPEVTLVLTVKVTIGLRIGNNLVAVFISVTEYQAWLGGSGVCPPWLPCRVSFLPPQMPVTGPQWRHPFQSKKISQRSLRGQLKKS